jgi:hypothetical protein
MGETQFLTTTGYVEQRVAVESEKILAHPEMDASEPPRRRLAGIRPAAETLAAGRGDAFA